MCLSWTFCIILFYLITSLFSPPCYLLSGDGSELKGRADCGRGQKAPRGLECSRQLCQAVCVIIAYSPHTMCDGSVCAVGFFVLVFLFVFFVLFFLFVFLFIFLFIFLLFVCLFVGYFSLSYVFLNIQLVLNSFLLSFSFLHRHKHRQKIICMRFHPLELQLATGEYNGAITLWKSLLSAKPVTSIKHW